MNSILLTNIQRFSLHDGPGIRTTVFLKGCSLRCPWCSNPENLTDEPQNYIKDGKEGTYGKYMTCDELYNEVIKDKNFYIGEISNYTIDTAWGLDRLPGGVTFSGGEALLQMDRLEPLLKRLKENHIHTAIESSFFASQNELKIALRYIDLFYVDIKILDEKSCSHILNENLKVYLENLTHLFNYRDMDGNKKPVVIRIPVIGGYTDGKANREKVCALIKKYKPIKVELIKEHNLGISKYKSLGMDAPDYKGVSDAIIEVYKRELERCGVPVEICKI